VVHIQCSKAACTTYFAVFISSLIAIFFSGISLAINNRWSFVETNNRIADVCCATICSNLGTYEQLFSSLQAGQVQFFFGPQTFCKKVTGSQVAAVKNELTCFDCGYSCTAGGARCVNIAARMQGKSQLTR